MMNEVTVKSGTPNMYATIPCKVLYSKTNPVDKIKCMHYDGKQFVIVDAAELRKLISAKKIYTCYGNNGDKFVKSIDYLKFFS